MRQQRRSNPRRKVTPNQPPIIRDITWRIGTIAGDTVQLLFDQTIADWVANGVLAALHEPGSQLPVSMVVYEDSVLLTYGETLAGPHSIAIKQNDMALRTQWGGFMAPGVQGQLTEEPLTLLFNRQDAYSVALSLSGYGGPIGMALSAENTIAGSYLYTQPSGFLAKYAWANAGFTRIGFDDDTSAETAIIYDGGPDNITVQPGKVVESQTAPINP